MTSVGVLQILLVLVGVGGAFTLSKPSPGSMFVYHPPLMFIGVLVFAGNAIFIQRRSNNNKLHATLQFCAILCVLLGYYAIHSTKEVYSKPHWWVFSERVSWHAVVGGLGTIMLASTGAFGTVFLNAFSTPRLRRPFASAHRFFGRLSFFLCLVALFLGWQKLHWDMPFWNSVFLIVIVGVVGLGMLTKSGWNFYGKFTVKDTLS